MKVPLGMHLPKEQEDDQVRSVNSIDFDVEALLGGVGQSPTSSNVKVPLECPECKRRGVTSYIKTYQLNFNEAMFLCPDKFCPYPLKEDSLADRFIFKRNVNEVHSEEAIKVSGTRTATNSISSFFNDLDVDNLFLHPDLLVLKSDKKDLHPPLEYDVFDCGKSNPIGSSLSQRQASHINIGNFSVISRDSDNSKESEFNLNVGVAAQSHERNSHSLAGNHQDVIASKPSSNDFQSTECSGGTNMAEDVYSSLAVKDDLSKNRLNMEDSTLFASPSQDILIYDISSTQSEVSAESKTTSCEDASLIPQKLAKKIADLKTAEMADLFSQNVTNVESTSQTSKSEAIETANKSISDSFETDSALAELSSQDILMDDISSSPLKPSLMPGLTFSSRPDDVPQVLPTTSTMEFNEDFVNIKEEEKPLSESFKSKPIQEKMEIQNEAKPKSTEDGNKDLESYFLDNHLSNAPRKVIYYSKMIQWTNEKNSCWLDAILQVFVSCNFMRAAINIYDPSVPNIWKKLINTYDQTQKALCDFNSDMASTYLSKKMSSVRIAFTELLKQKVKFKVGEFQSLYEMFPCSVELESKFKAIFSINLLWNFQCQTCKHQRARRSKGMIVSLPNTAGHFHPLNAEFHRTCYECKSPNASTTIWMESFPPCLVMHFGKGLPHSNLRVLDFAFCGQLYCVFGVVQYKTEGFPHFITWIRDVEKDLWLICDDLASPILTWQPTQPNIPCNEIHMVFWERKVTKEIEHFDQNDLAPILNKEAIALGEKIPVEQLLMHEDETIVINEDEVKSDSDLEIKCKGS